MCRPLGVRSRGTLRYAAGPGSLEAGGRRPFDAPRMRCVSAHDGWSTHFTPDREAAVADTIA